MKGADEKAHTFRICNIVNGVAVSEGFNYMANNYFCAGGNSVDCHELVGAFRWWLVGHDEMLDWCWIYTGTLISLER